VDVDEIADAIQSPEAAASAQHVSDAAVTLVKNEGGIVPLTPSAPVCAILAVEQHTSVSGQRFRQEFARRAPGAKIWFVDGSMPEAELEASMPAAGSCQAIVVAAFISAAAEKGSVALPGDLAAFLQKLTE